MMDDRPIGYSMHRLMYTNREYWYYLKKLSLFKNKKRDIFVYASKEFKEELECSGICGDITTFGCESFSSIETKINNHTFDFRFGYSMFGGLSLKIIRSYDDRAGPSLVMKDYVADFNRIRKIIADWDNWETYVNVTHVLAGDIKVCEWKDGDWK